MSAEMEMESSRSSRVLLLGKGLLAKTVCHYLEDKGFEPLSPAMQETPLEALQRTRAHTVVYDVMGLNEAADFIQSVRTVLPDIRVIGISMKDEPQYAAYLFSLGISAYVWKGDIEHELEEALGAVVGKQARYLSPHIRSKLSVQEA